MALAFLAVSAAALSGAAAPGRALPRAQRAEPVVASRQVSHAAAGPFGPVLFRFVSMPDFINADVGDTQLRAGHGWNPGDPNSINKYWALGIRTVLDQVESERPALVLVAGDLVNGHWLADTQHTGIFGPTSTNPQRLRAVATAGRFYYRAFARRFGLRRLPVYPAVGDHDVGDDPWPPGWLKVAAIPIYRRVWGDEFTTTSAGHYRFRMHPTGPSRHTAYAWRHRNTLFVTVDEFDKTPQGMKQILDPDQLRWLSHVLAQARAPGSGVQHIVVQGHLPVLGSQPPVIPSFATSHLYYAGGAGSAFWRVLRRYHVDAYLAGEFHAYSMRDDGVMQIVHGSVIGEGHMNYVVATVYTHRIVFTVKQFSGSTSGTARLWQMSYARSPAHIVINPNPVTVAQWQVG